MTADTRDKRLSLISMGDDVNPTLPVPDNGIAEEDRRHLLGLYSRRSGIGGYDLSLRSSQRAIRI